MYIFKNYNSKEIKEFESKHEFLDYIDLICESNDLCKPSERQVLCEAKGIPDEQGTCWDGICISGEGISDNRSHMLGYYRYNSCN